MWNQLLVARSFVALQPTATVTGVPVTGDREFRATTDQMLAMIDRLREIEQAKQQVEFGSAEFIAMAVDAEHLSRVVFRWAGMQLQMAEASAGAVQRGEVSSEPLENVESRPLDRILANWREAQLRFEIARPGSPEAAAAADAVERLREEFRATERAKFESLSRDGGSGATTD